MKDQIRWTELRKARSSLKEVARREGKTLDEVRESIIECIEDAHSNPDPQARAKWAESPFGDRAPTPEEFVAWCIRLVREKEAEEQQ